MSETGVFAIRPVDIQIICYVKSVSVIVLAFDIASVIYRINYLFKIAVCSDRPTEYIQLVSGIYIDGVIRFNVVA